MTTTTSLDTGVLLTAVLSGAFLAALVTAVINLWLAGRKARDEERNRQRTAFAEAFASYSSYKEFPYAIRRRRVDAAAEDRVRLSEALREIQSDIAYHVAWTAAESEVVGHAYASLIEHVRSAAGTAMRDAWNSPGTGTDEAMNIPPDTVDLSSLRPDETAYMDAVRAHLKGLTRWWAR